MFKSLRTASAMVVAVAAAIHPAQAQDDLTPGPFNVSLETGIQFLDLPGARYGSGSDNGYADDTTNTHESDELFKLIFGYSLPANVAEEFLGTRQQLELSLSNVSVDDENKFSGTGTSHFDISGTGGSASNAGATWRGEYEYQSRELAVRLLGETKSDGDAISTRYLGASYSEITQTYATNALAFSSSPIVDERLETQLFSLFLGTQQNIPIRQGLAFVMGGEAGLFYADSRLKGTQDPSGVYGGGASTTTLSVTRGDTEWGPRLKAKTGLLLTADDGKSTIGIYGQADYINNMAYIDNPNTAGESLKISNGDTLSYSLNFDFTWWF